MPHVCDAILGVSWRESGDERAECSDVCYYGFRERGPQVGFLFAPYNAARGGQFWRVEPAVELRFVRRVDLQVAVRESAQAAVGCKALHVFDDRRGEEEAQKALAARNCPAHLCAQRSLVA